MANPSHVAGQLTPHASQPAAPAALTLHPGVTSAGIETESQGDNSETQPATPAESRNEMYKHRTCGAIFDNFATSPTQPIPACPECGQVFDYQASCHPDVQCLPLSESVVLFDHNRFDSDARIKAPLNREQLAYLITAGYSSAMGGYVAADISDEDWENVYALASR